MSAFLAYESYLVDIGTSVADWKTQFETSLTTQGWQIFDSTDDWTEFIPPVGQPIGIPYGNGVLRVYFTATTVRFEPRLRFEENQSSVWHIRNANTTTSSNSSYNMSLTIDGVTWTQANTVSPYTQDTRTEALYNTLVADVASYPDGRDAYNYVLRTDMSPNVIEFTRIDPSTDNQLPLVDSSVNLTVTRVETSLSPSKTSPFRPYTFPFTNGNYSVNIDLASGFIYYLSIFDRSIVLATKTTTAYYGPVAGTWIDNQLARDQTPDGLVPVELYVVDASDRNSTSYRFDIIPSHSIGYYSVTTDEQVSPESYPLLASSSSYYASVAKLPFGKMTPSDLGKLSMLLPREHQYFNFDGLAYAGGVNVYYGILLAPVYPIVNVEIFKGYFASEQSGRGWAAETTSSFLEDIYMYTATATDESLHLARIVDVTTAATSDASDIATSIAVSDTSLFPTSGTIIVNNEIIQYTSKTATTFSGLSRAQYGTAAGAITTGDIVYATNWFVKINDGAILAGTTKPTAQ